MDRGAFIHSQDAKSLKSAITIEDFANHASAFISCLIAVTAKNRYMQEYIRHAVIWDNETVAL